jgi:hypothetical protein
VCPSDLLQKLAGVLSSASDYEGRATIALRRNCRARFSALV